MSAGRILGAVLAGGESRRMGTDKASLEVGGRAMIDRAAAALRPHCTEVVVVSAREDVPPGPWRVVPDLRPASGPLGGLETALVEAERGGWDAVAVLAVDLPLVDDRGVGMLLGGWAQERGAVAAAREGDPAFEPLCAVYPTGAGATASALLDGGERAARSLFERLGGRTLPGVTGAGANVNTPADAARAEEKLR